MKNGMATSRNLCLRSIQVLCAPPFSVSSSCFSFYVSIIGNMAANEVYANAPIAMVVAEIRHPISEPLSPAEWNNIKLALAEAVPINRTESILEIDIQSGQQHMSKLTRFVSRDLHQSISFRPDAIVIESTDYHGWDVFRGMISLALHARQDTAPVDGLERVGLRYMDEIRPPADITSIDWTDWVSPELLGPVSLPELVEKPAISRQGTMVLSSAPGVTYTVRYGSGVGQAFASSPNLRRRTEPAGEFFLIDTDGAWQPVAQAVPEFSAENVELILNDIHEPISLIFESLITDRLRNEVLRDER